MASLSGSCVGTVSGKGKITFSWSVSSTNSLTRTISYTVKLTGLIDGNITNSSFTISLGASPGTIDTSSISVPAGTSTNKSDTILKTGSFHVTHNSSTGKATFSVTSYPYVGINSSNTSSCTCSATFELNPITIYSNCSAPTSISVSPAIVTPSGSLTVTWSGAKAGTNNAISGYTIYYRVGSNPTTSAYTGTKSATSSPATITLSSATRGSTVFVKIVTKGSASGYNSSISSVTASAVINSLPAAPTVTGSSGSVAPGASLSWTVKAGTDSNSGQSLSVYYATSATGTKTIYSSGTKITASSTRGSSTTYHFWTYDGLEYSSTATQVQITINASKPAAPTVTGSSGTVVPRASLSWTVTGTGTLYYNTTNSTATATSFSSTVTATASSTRGSSTTYYFWAYNNGEFSNAATKVITISTLPAAPTIKNGSTTLTAGGSTVISSGGSFSITATGTSVNYNSSTATPSPGTTSSKTVTVATSATSGSAYTYYFWSFNSLGEASDKVSFTVKKNKKPNTPTIAAKSGIKVINSANYFPGAGGSVSLNITSGANTNYNNNTYIYYTTATTAPSTSLSKIAVSGAETKTITSTLSNNTTYYAWVYDGLEFSSAASYTATKLTAPNAITWTTVTINNSYANNSTSLSRAKYAWYITSCAATHNARVPATVTYQIAMLQSTGCTEAASSVSSNLVTIKTFTGVPSNTSTTSFAYNVYNAIAANKWNDALKTKNVSWLVKAVVDDGLNPAISTYYFHTSNSYYAVPKGPSINVKDDIHNKDNSSNVDSSTLNTTSNSLYFYQKLFVDYYKDSSMTGVPEATLKIGTTTYTPTVEIVSTGTDSTKEKIKISFTNSVSLTAHTTATLTLKLKHASSANAYKYATITGNLLRVRDLPSISSITLPTTDKYYPYAPPTTGNYTIQVPNPFNVTTSAALKSNWFIDYSTGFGFQIANSAGTTALFAANTASTPYSASATAWQFSVPKATMFNWSTYVSASTGKLWTSAQLYGDQTYKVRTVVSDYFGRKITSAYSSNGTFNFESTPTVTFKLYGNTQSNPNNVSTPYPTSGDNIRLLPDQKVKLEFSMIHKSAYPANSISIPIKINGTQVGTFTNPSAIPGKTTNTTELVTLGTSSSYTVGALGTGKTLIPIYCYGKFNTTSTTVLSGDTLAVSGTSGKLYYKAQPWYNPTLNINSVHIFTQDGEHKITLKYTVATWAASDGITFPTTTNSSELYLVTSTSNNPTAENVGTYHSKITGTSNRNFSDTINIITAPTVSNLQTYTTIFNVGSAFSTGDLEKIQNLTLGGAMTATGCWYTTTRTQWFKSNTVYGRLQTPSMALRQDNIGIFANNKNYLGDLTEASPYHPSLQNTKGVIFVKANGNASMVVVQNADDTNSFVYDIPNGTLTLYTSASANSSTWIETHSINFKDGIFK